MADTFNRGGMQGQGGTTGGTTTQRGGTGGGAGQEAGGVMETIRDVASSVTGRVGDAFDTARQGVTDAASTAYRSAGDALENVTGFMSRHPVPTFFCGLGLGFLLAMALNQMSSHGSRSSY